MNPNSEPNGIPKQEELTEYRELSSKASQLLKRGENLPTSLEEALELLDEYRVQCIELKIMLDATESYVASMSGASERERRSQDALDRLHAELATQKPKTEEMRTKLAQTQAALETLQAKRGADADEEVRALLAEQRAAREELQARLDEESGRADNLHEQLAAERSMAAELRAELEEARATLAQSPGDAHPAASGGDSSARIAALEARLDAEREQHEHAREALQREIQQAKEAERTAISKLKSAEQDLYILQTRTQMLANRIAEQEQERTRTQPEKPQGLMNRFVSRFSRSRSDEGGETPSTDTPGE